MEGLPFLPGNTFRDPTVSECFCFHSKRLIANVHVLLSFNGPGIARLFESIFLIDSLVTTLTSGMDLEIRRYVNTNIMYMQLLL